MNNEREKKKDKGVEQSELRPDPPSRPVMVLSYLDTVRSAVSALSSACEQVSKVKEQRRR